MPSLADVIKLSHAASGSTYAGDQMPLGSVGTPDDVPEALRPPSRSYTNADLTPAARRKAAGIDDSAPAADAVRPDYVAPDGGRAEQDRLLAEAKGTLKTADPFAKMLESAGNAGAGEALQRHQGPGEAAVRSLGDTTAAMYKGATHIPGDLVGGLLGLPGAIAHGYESIPEGLQAIIDPATWRGMPDAAKQMYTELANDPEQATRLFGGMIAAGPAGDLMAGAIPKVPGVVGGAISKLGRGVQAVGSSPLVEGTGMLRKGAAILHPGLGTLAGAVGPEMLTGLGKAIEGAGAKVSNIPNSASLDALRNVANTDVGAKVRDVFTPTLTEDEQAAQSVRATVDAARRYVDQGASRGQAAQRAGWPLAGDFELNDAGQPVNKYGAGDFGTHPGQNVEAQRPYGPASRGESGRAVPGFEGRNSPGRVEGPKTFANSVRAEKRNPNGGHVSALGALDDLAGPTQRMQRKSYSAQDVLDNPASQRYMNEQFDQNQPVADAARVRSDDDEAARLLGALRKHQAAGDATFDSHLTGPEVDLSDAVSPEAALSKLSRGRAQTHSRRRNSALAETY